VTIHNLFLFYYFLHTSFEKEWLLGFCPWRGSLYNLEANTAIHDKFVDLHSSNMDKNNSNNMELHLQLV
jgi:hypothetical protein